MLTNKDLQNSEFEITRPDKGLRIIFFQDTVVKQYDHGSLKSAEAEQKKRLRQEVEAYKRLNALACPFVPSMQAYSLEEKWLRLTRVQGYNLLQLSQENGSKWPLSIIMDQIHDMNHWLRSHHFPDMAHNIKDCILNNESRLYLVDFEAYREPADVQQKCDLYKSLVKDILDRMVIRKYRKAKFTRRFLQLAAAILIHRPFYIVPIWQELVLKNRESR